MITSTAYLSAKWSPLPNEIEIASSGPDRGPDRRHPRRDLGSPGQRDEEKKTAAKRGNIRKPGENDGK